MWCVVTSHSTGRAATDSRAREEPVPGQSQVTGVETGVATGNRDDPQHRRSCSPATSPAAQTPNHALARCKQRKVPLLSLSQVPHITKPPNCPIPISVRLPGSVAFWPSCPVPFVYYSLPRFSTPACPSDIIATAFPSEPTVGYLLLL